MKMYTTSEIRNLALIGHGDRTRHPDSRRLGGMRLPLGAALMGGGPVVLVHLAQRAQDELTVHPVIAVVAVHGAAGLDRAAANCARQRALTQAPVADEPRVIFRRDGHLSSL